MKRRSILISLIVIGVILTGTSYAIIESAVAIWLFDEGEGGEVEDSTGNGNDGDLKSRAEWVDGKFGKALEFDGKNDYVDVADRPSLNITDAITIVMWAKRSSTANDDNERAVIKGSSGEPGSYALSIRLGKYHFAVHVDGDWRFFDRETWTDTNWHHVAGTYDSSTREYNLYKDGVSISSRTLKGLANYTIDTIDANLGMGRWVFGPKYFNGTLDEVAIFNEALSEDDIKAIMEMGLLDILVVSPSGKLATAWGKIKTQ